MALESWEIIIFNLALGSLFSGFLLFFFSIFTAGFHVGHAGHGGHSSHIGHFGHLTQHFHLPHIGHFGHLTHGIHTHNHIVHHGKLQQNPSTPILLILSAFLLMFGAVGTVVYQLDVFDPLIRIFTVLVLPIGFVKFISIIWNKIIGNEYGYEIPVVSVDNMVIALTAVDEKGGLVLADTGDYDRPGSLKTKEKMKMFARTLPGVSIERNKTAFVIDIDKKNALIIDLWPRMAKKDTKSNE